MSETYAQEELRRAMDSVIRSELSEIRLELKVVRELLERMVRVEERQINQTGDIQRLESQLALVFQQLRTLEAVKTEQIVAVAETRKSVGNFERAGWIVLSAGAMAAFEYFRR